MKVDAAKKRKKNFQSLCNLLCEQPVFGTQRPPQRIVFRQLIQPPVGGTDAVDQAHMQTHSEIAFL